MEHWKAVVGFEGLYEVSDHGRVRSIQARNRWPAGRILRGAPNQRSGHLVVHLCKSGTQVLRYVHRLVLETFVGTGPAGHETRHFPDPSPKNNRLDNLAWGLRCENMIDRSRQGVCKLTCGDVERIRDMRACKVQGVEAARWFSVHPTSICDIHSGRSWSHA